MLACIITFLSRHQMKYRMRALLYAIAFVAAPAHAADDCGFVKKVELPSRQQVAVVSSGALEPCSTGSYAVRVYSTAHAAPASIPTIT